MRAPEHSLRGPGSRSPQSRLRSSYCSFFLHCFLSSLILTWSCIPSNPLRYHSILFRQWNTVRGILFKIYCCMYQYAKTRTSRCRSTCTALVQSIRHRFCLVCGEMQCDKNPTVEASANVFSLTLFWGLLQSHGGFRKLFQQGSSSHEQLETFFYSNRRQHTHCLVHIYKVFVSRKRIHPLTNPGLLYFVSDARNPQAPRVRREDCQCRPRVLHPIRLLFNRICWHHGWHLSSATGREALGKGRCELFVNCSYLAMAWLRCRISFALLRGSVYSGKPLSQKVSNTPFRRKSMTQHASFVTV